MQMYGQKMTSGGGYGGDHKTPLPTLVFREKPPAPPSPTRLRFPSDVPANKVRFNGSVPGRRVSPRDHTWVSPLAIDQERINLMVKMYENGSTLVQISEKLGCSRATVAKYLDDQGVKRLRRKKPLDLKLIKMLLDEGHSIRRVAKLNNVSASTLKRRLEEEQII